MHEATTNLLNEIKKERKAKADAEIADVKALLTRAGQTITQAKKPEDLDNLVEEIGKHANNNGNSALQGDQELSRQLSSAFEFVKQWQNYLAHLAAGQTDQARNDLQNLSNNNYGDGLLPRSKLLELESPDRLLAPSGKPAPAASAPALQAQAIVDGIKTLDDIKPALAKLEPLRQSDMAELQNVFSPVVHDASRLRGPESRTAPAAGSRLQLQPKLGGRPAGSPLAIASQHAARALWLVQGTAANTGRKAARIHPPRHR